MQSVRATRVPGQRPSGWNVLVSRGEAERVDSLQATTFPGAHGTPLPRAVESAACCGLVNGPSHPPHRETIAERGFAEGWGPVRAARDGVSVAVIGSDRGLAAAQLRRSGTM